jgi:hypothetical protein
LRAKSLHQVVEFSPPSGQSPGKAMIHIVGLAIVSMIGSISLALAQGLGGPLGSNQRPTGGVLPLFSGSQNAAVQKHLGPTGKPCVTVVGYAHPQTVNPNIFEHMILATNDCSQPIKMRVCYYQSQQCIPIDVPQYGRKEMVLGIMPAMSQFRFEYRENFDQGNGALGRPLN